MIRNPSGDLPVQVVVKVTLVCPNVKEAEGAQPARLVNLKVDDEFFVL